MDVNEIIIEKYQRVYGELVKTFIGKVKNSDIDGMPEPFLPIFGADYGSADVKIAFAGMETNGWRELKNLIDRGDLSLGENCGPWSADDFSEVLYGKNGSLRTFWSFVTRFLAEYHACDHASILESASVMQSFAWANCNAIERLNVINKNLDQSKPKVSHETWMPIKEASRRFDHGKHVIDVFLPDVLLIMWWSPDESYLTDRMGPVKMRRLVTDHLLYMEFEETDTRVIWTAHPSYLRRTRTEASILNLCVGLAKNGSQGFTPSTALNQPTPP